MEPMRKLTVSAIQTIQNQIIQKDSEEWSCCVCNDPIALPVGDVRRLALDVKCDKCSESERLKSAERQNANAQSRREGLLATIPTAFRNTLREKLPFPSKLDAALRWKFGGKGLLLHGPTGCGKSRIIWEVAKREVLAGMTVRHVNAFELSRYPSLFMSSSDAAVKFADELAGANILLLDDVFKAKPTERVEELLFGVIDERGSWDRPCLITLNDTGETLEGRLSVDRGPALIRRLREYCHPIQFEP